jgi:phosphatidate cytidylyltransferase
MLHWRLLLGTLIIAALAGLCWMDHLAALPGTWLMPLALVAVVLATGEIVQLLTAAGAPHRGDCPNFRVNENGTAPFAARAAIVYGGNVFMVLASWMPILLANFGLWNYLGEGLLSWQAAISLMGWPLVALAICTLIVFINEMRLFEKPGRATAHMAASFFALIYVGLLFSFLIQLRLTGGIGSLALLIVVVKMGDTGAYFTGRLLGRHKMTPVLSPGKTVEGAIGAIFFACLSAWLCGYLIFPLLDADCFAKPGWIWIIYGLFIGIAGMLGDLAESLIKRDAGRKDSSTWMPGFGGVLDVLDSLLFAAPVGWLFWILTSGL